MEKNRVILTGDRQAGKSTVCRKILEVLSPAPLFGFKTYRTSEGFALSAWNGPPVPFASLDRSAGDLRMDLSAFNTAGAEALFPPSESAWFVMDELGIMEQRASAFVQAVRDAWAGPNPGIAVVQKRALDFWLRQMGASPGRVYEITPQNRDRAPAAVLEMLSAPADPSVTDHR